MGAAASIIPHTVMGVVGLVRSFRRPDSVGPNPVLATIQGRHDAELRAAREETHRANTAREAAIQAAARANADHEAAV